MKQWIDCKERLPENPKGLLRMKHYLTCSVNGAIQILMWANGWNCVIDGYGNILRDKEIKDVVAWMELPKPYEVNHE